VPEANADCVICELPKQPTTHGSTRLQYVMMCGRCGTYEIAYEPPDVHRAVQQLDAKERPLFSHWVYEQNRLGIVPNITGDVIPIILSRQKFTFVETTRRLLTHLLENTPVPGQHINALGFKVQAALQQFNTAYISEIAKYLWQEQLLTVIDPIPVQTTVPTLLRQSVVLTPRGIMQAEEWRRSYVASAQGFVAMWFDEQMGSAWEDGFYPAIDGAGYVPQRIDRKEHVNKICDEIIAEIRRSRFVVADFTGQRGGVYYEAGYAGGRDIPVIWTCRKDDFEKVHFDIRQYNCIVWETPQELARKLKVRIEAVIGVGPRKQRV
jgi:hypothetical protein